jgi:hypothetical protein
MQKCLKGTDSNGIVAVYMSEGGTKTTYDEKTKQADRRIQYVYNEYCNPENISKHILIQNII